MTISLRSLANYKTATIKRIERRIAPHLWESGYVTGPVGASRPLKLWIGSDNKTWRLNGLSVNEFFGIREDGLIVDGDGGGLVTLPFIGLSLEDLLRVERWTVEQFSEKA